MLNQLLSFDCVEIVLGGDYNLVLEVEKDKSGGNPTTYKNSLKEVRYIASLLELEEKSGVSIIQMSKDSPGGGGNLMCTAV